MLLTKLDKFDNAIVEKYWTPVDWPKGGKLVYAYTRKALINLDGGSILDGGRRPSCRFELSELTCVKCSALVDTIVLTPSSRSVLDDALEAARKGFDVSIGGRYGWYYDERLCKSCKNERSEQRRLQKEKLLVHQEAERLAAEEIRNKKRFAAQAQYGIRFLGDCPECTKGFLIVKFANRNFMPFCGCSSYNPHKRDTCDYTCPLAAERHKEMLEVVESTAKHNINCFK